MPRVAAIDCGTNSIRLLVAEGDGADLRDVHREMRVVRLGQGVDATGVLSAEALRRTRAALVDYARICARKGVERARMVATSATRDAANRDEFFAMTREVLGTEAEVITGDEEARLSFAGAIGAATADPGPCLVVDVGGGSTELVLGDTHGATGTGSGTGTGTGTGSGSGSGSAGTGQADAVAVRAARSVDIGCVRITERCLPSDPPTASELAAAEELATAVLAEAFDAVPVADARTWIGVAGTVTTLSAVHQGLAEYDPARTHGSRLSTADIVAVQRRLAAMTSAERGALGPIHPGRVDVITGGAVIVRVLAQQLADRAGIGGLLVSEQDILDGIALSLT